MLTPLLIIARTVQIAASILFAGIFTFDLVMLARGTAISRRSNGAYCAWLFGV
jgi:hypothetical protein